MNNEYLGKCLLDRGFATWFRYMFRVLEGTPFIIEQLHKDLLETLEDVFNGNKTRLVLNLPPRSGKTTLAKYLVAYSLTTNPKSNIIYTSYSQSLLSDIALSVQNILEHPIYKAMYPSTLRYEEEYTNPVDDFWAEYLKKETGKNLYSSKKIITRHGGKVVFISIGGQITGQGAGCRNAKKFSGFLCLDDPNKPSDTYSQVMREKVVRYFEETLLSRLNNSNVPIIEIQQRLHLEDLSGVLIKKYNFDILKKPLLDKNGVCQLPSQYTIERIKELKVNNYSFQAQYMQEPIILGGSVIKREWFGYYNPTLSQTYKRIVISADTAMTVKEKSDYTCLLVGGVTAQNKLHILEMVHAKFEYPELKQAVINLYNKYKEGETKCSAIYIENKASGIQLIQDFKKVGLPVCGIDVTKDKLTRVEEILEYLASGLVLLPESESYGNNPEFLAECEAFSRDMSHVHDDQCFVAGTKIATLFGYKNIENIKKGDLVLTPYGLKRVLNACCTGEADVITRNGLTGTKNHRTFINGIFDNLENLNYDVKVDTLSLKGLLKWKYQILLCSMELNTDLWGRRGIILANQLQMKDEKVLKDFILRFGNFIVGKKFRKAMLFTIKTVIILITTLATWNVFQGLNILQDIEKAKLNILVLQKQLNILQRLGNWLQLGINQKKAELGTENTPKHHCQKRGHIESKKSVKFVGKNIPLKLNIKNIVVNNAKLKHITLDKKQKVYNLTVEDAHVYYANNILVSNCDALVHIVNNTIANRKVSLLEVL